MNIQSPLNTAVPGSTATYTNQTGNAQPQASPATGAAAPITTQAVPQTAAGAKVGAVAGATSQQHLQQAIDKVSQVVGLYSNELRFSIDKDTNMEVVKVVDTQTNQVIRQFPSEEMLQIAQHIDKIVGLFVQNQA